MRTISTTFTPLPKRVYFYLTKQCNAECPYCYHGTLDNEDLDYTVLHRMLVELSTFGLDELRLTGGEPTLHTRFSDILDICEALRMPAVIQTNGLWDRKTLSRLVRQQDLAVVVSPKVGPGPRQPLAERALRNLRELLSARPDARVTVELVCSRTNVRPLLETYSAVKREFPKATLYLLPVKASPDNTNADELLRDQDYSFIESYLQGHGIQFGWGGTCHAGIRSCNLDYDNALGEFVVYGCSFVARDSSANQREMRFNFSEPEHFSEIWQEDAAWSYFRKCDPGKCALEKEGHSSAFFRFIRRVAV